MVRVQNFLPRDAMRELARSVLSAGVRPSVRYVRVGLLYCIQTAEDIIKHLSWPGSPMS